MRKRRKILYTKNKFPVKVHSNTKIQIIPARGQHLNMWEKSAQVGLEVSYAHYNTLERTDLKERN